MLKEDDDFQDSLTILNIFIEHLSISISLSLSLSLSIYIYIYIYIYINLTKRIIFIDFFNNERSNMWLYIDLISTFLFKYRSYNLRSMLQNNKVWGTVYLIHNGWADMYILIHKIYVLILSKCYLMEFLTIPVNCCLFYYIFLIEGHNYYYFIIFFFFSSLSK